MFDFHQKRKLRSVFGSRVTQGVILGAAILVLLSAYNRYLIALDMAERRTAVESEIHSLEERRESLEAEVKYLSNERGIEAEMRRQFDIAREGEQVVIILEDEIKPDGEGSNEASSTEARPWYRFW
jgi:cell division protein FtsB